MADTVTTVILAAIAKEESGRQAYVGDLLHLHAALVASFAPVRQEEIEKLGLSGVFTQGSRRFIYLPPMKDSAHWLPLLSVLVHQTRLSFQVMLFGGSEPYEKAFAIRFESPEGEAFGRDLFGRHNYYHAQLCTHVRPSGVKSTEIEWLPVTQPALVLDADSEDALLASLLISLYGTHFLTELRQALGELTSSIRNMHVVRIQPEYWKIQLRNGGEEYVRTSMADERAEERLKLEYAGGTLTRTTPQAWHEASPQNRKDRTHRRE